MNIEEEKQLVAEKMRELGSAFEQKLSETLLLANDVQSLRLKRCFGDIWQRYLDEVEKEDQS